MNYKINRIGFLLTMFMLLSTSPTNTYSSVVDEVDDFKVEFTPEDVLMNISTSMSLGDIKEYNITLTEQNSTLTIVAEINYPAGRIWGVYVESFDFYYASKATENYSGFIKIMDHVSNYTAVHVTKSPGEYVLAIHNSHLHEEPDTDFQLLVLNGTLGAETTVPVISGDIQSHIVSSNISGFQLITFIALFLLCFILIPKRRKSSI